MGDRPDGVRDRTCVEHSPSIVLDPTANESVYRRQFYRKQVDRTLTDDSHEHARRCSSNAVASCSFSPPRGFLAQGNSQRCIQSVAGFGSGHRDGRDGNSNDFKLAYAEA